MKTKVMGIIVFLLGVVGAISLGWHEIFINIPSVMYVVLVAGGLALMRFRRGDGVAGFLKNLKRYAIVSGVLGMMTGLLQMASAGSFDLAGFYVGFGTSLLTVFYGIIFYCVLDTFTGRVTV